MLSINQAGVLWVEITLRAIALMLSIPIAVLLIECSAAVFPSRWVGWYNPSPSLSGGDPEGVPTPAPRPKVAVLVPAHNEVFGIGATLQTLLPQLTAQDHLVVIADNCDDETAAVARTYGATVIERQEPDQSRRGKGYALDYGLRFIAEEPPKVVVVVDADCIVHSGAIERIARLAIATARPVQATYLMSQPDDPGLKSLLSTLAVTVKNLVRPSGLDRLGLPCLLTGSGMAFPWSVISSLSLAGSNTVDDMQLALDLAIAGHPPIYSREAQVTGRLMQQRAALSQRTRWEHGHLETLLTQVPRLLKASVQQRRFDLFAIALDLCVPPLSLLVMIWATATGAALLAGFLGAIWFPVSILAIEGLLILISIVGAWAKFGRDFLPVLTLLAAPLYILWKIPLYLAFLVQPQTKWTRTERDGADAPES